ncbi:chromosome segregation protein SMC [Oceanobacillus manasiensis]|uniref:chromosome segregation protein SMC n=1 Tax=Oceanobacillus manasiensis TaxID=586413 RepID=UPI0005A9BF36|nr:chromosome segregation protein SMC [Oceanobacillus manasiensis]
MYLKRLESVGFKSFAERISVDFVPGVTAVVGPNGSGKSNITDAIRWVLGEQSAKSLRGSKMEDIIFQGSDSRKALNVAEVTLVLDNQDRALPVDYEEVSVTRRVYRSGDSEFYMNKQACRLKDIVDLFMDSGLGREAFSIISQGKVEEILSSKAEERRTIFEEAAGVLKYKQRKKKAEYKLAETQENLNRVEDIIHEIEQQVNPLKTQADKAEKYVELKEKLSQEEIAFLITDIENLHSEWKSLLEDLEKNKHVELEMKQGIQQKEAAIEEDQQVINRLDSKIEEMQAQLLSATEELEKNEGKKQLLFERSKHFSENKEKLEAQKQEASSRVGTLHEQLIIERKNLHELQELRKETSKRVKHLEKDLTTSQDDIAEKIEDLKSEYIEYLNKQAAKRNEKQSIAKQMLQMNGKRDKQVGKFQDLIKSRQELLEKLQAYEADYQKQEKEFKEHKDVMESIKAELRTSRNTFQEQQTKLYQGYQYIEKLKSKKEMLEEMKEDFQGFFQGVKAVLKARKENQLQEIHGAVIELVDVPKKYITAMETVLGGQSQHIVVQHDQAARKAISWLKQTNNGRATFLPLESIQERFISNDLLAKIENHPGFIGIASKLVQTNPTYQRAVNHLMGHVIIANTLKDANDIAQQVMRRYRIVTLEGDVVNPGGAMSGGAQKKTNQSLFSREKDLQEMIGKLNTFQEKTIAFEKQVAEQKSHVAVLEKQLPSKEEELSQKQRLMQETHAQLRELQLKKETLDDNLTIYDQDKQQFDEDRDYFKTRENQLLKELDQIKQSLENIQAEIDQLSNKEAIMKENYGEMQQELHEKQVQLAEQEERMKNQREKSDGLETQLSEAKQQYDRYARELNDLLEYELSEESEKEIELTIERKSEEKQSLTVDIQKERTTRHERAKLLQEKEKELKEENNAHQEQVKKINEQEVKVNRVDVDLENRLTHLQTEYMITFEKAQQSYKKAEDMEAAKENVKQLKLEIDRLGTVNLGAIEEYERISERYSFLTDQQTDLVEAKQTLYTVIAEMDEEMKKRFDETFSKIKAEFTEVFRQLFGGGHAELKLTDPKNLLDTGVDIIAQPPGKKLQHLGLLSGGERALTAIALLFAILRVRPVPFCVLDEVEAALDEANVARFAKYVNHYSKNTQFIVITHRQGTMEEADVLYGVTMQESGVSRLVSVRLEDTKSLVKS